MFKKKKKKTSKYQKYELSSSRKVEQQLREARLLPTQRRLRFPPRGAAGNGAAQRGSASAEAVPAPALLSAGGAISHPYLPAPPAEMPSFTRGLVVFPSFPQGFRAKREKKGFLAIPLEHRFSLCWEIVGPARCGAVLAEDTPQTGQ